MDLAFKMAIARGTAGAGQAVRRMAALATWVALLALLGSCTEDAKPGVTAKADTAGPKDSGVDSGGADSETPSDATDIADAGETVSADAIADGSDGSTPPDGASGCLSDDQCAKSLQVKSCQLAVCDKASGQCKAAPKPGTCCDDSACPAPACTDAKCNVETALCEYKPILDCCAGQITSLKETFEQKSMAGFQETAGPTNGNVKWQVETRRAHSGKYSLYLGNECGSYDASQTKENGCSGGGTGGAISSKLKSPSLNLPADKPSILHFWVWIDAEPSWLATLSKSTSCPQPCAIDAVCAQEPQSGTSLCLTEKDVLKIKVNDTYLPWTSVTVGKNTGGQWKHILVDLAPYTGQGINVSWEFNTGNGLKNAFEGVYLDDIIVQTLCAKEGTLCDAAAKCKPDDSPCTSEDCNVFVNGTGGKGLCMFDMTPGCCIGVNDCSDNNDCTVDSCTKAAGASQGKCKSVPNAANLQCCQPATGLSEGFENGLSTWQQTETSKVVKWQINPTGGANGGASLYFGDATFGSYDDQSMKPKSPSGIICSKALKLPAGTMYNVAKFQLNLATEWDGKPAENYVNPPVIPNVTVPKVDELKVLVRYAGQYCGASGCKATGTGLPDGLWSSDVIKGTTGGKFTTVKVNLDKYAGKDIELCFSFDTGDPTANQYKGANIDDLKVEVVCIEDPCDSAAECAGTCGKCEAPLCQAGVCACEKVPGCCTSDGGCDDTDTCTTDKCETGICTHALNSPTCCSNKSTVQESWEKTDGKLPTGWKSQFLTGTSIVSGGKPYSKLVPWSVSGTKGYGGSLYSLYFGTNGVTYNAGNEVPAAVVRSPELTIPKNGTSLITFELFLSTEWNPPANSPTWKFVPPIDPTYTDRLRIGMFDMGEKDVTKASAWLWDSYQVQGSTAGKWREVVIKIPDTWKGKTVKLQFEFDAGTTNNNSYEGAFIDDLSLSTVCDKPECLADSDCSPANADACKSYFCAKDPKALLFSCKTDFKPGPGCCSASAPVPTETFEGGDLSKTSWVPSDSSSAVKWQVLKTSNTNGNFSAYFGNATALNYVDGTKAVTGYLESKTAVQLSADSKKSAVLSFKLWADIEASIETFQVKVTLTETNQSTVVWDHKVTTDFDPKKDLKSLVEKKINLSAFKGKGSISIQIFFDSVDGIKNTGQGLYIDDLAILEPCL